jgi:hypothetical protein
MRIASAFIGILISAAVMLFARSAWADTAWSVAAGSCAPLSTNGANWANTASNGGVTQATGFNGTVKFVCPVSVLNGTSPPNRMYVTYQDSSGTTNTSEVAVSLIKAPRGGGSTSVTASFDSDASSATGITEDFSAISGGFDFDTYYYYIVISITRTSGVTTSAYHVSLDYAVP